VTDIPDDYRDPATPDDVKIQLDPREPVSDPSLGIEVSIGDTRRPKNRLVAIGDSLTHGFQSGAIFNTDLSYPSLIARELGWYEQFRHPHYDGFGGLPANIEYLARQLEHEFGSEISFWELPHALFRVRHLLDQIEDWWERGGGSQLPNVVGINHNLGIYGWDVRDALYWTADLLQAQIAAPTDQLLSQTVQNANERAALRVLATARDEDGTALTPLQAAAKLGREGSIGERGDSADPGDGIETLIVFLGANNALSTVTQLRVSWSDTGYEDPIQKDRFNVWRPTHFADEFDALVTEVKKIRARHVIITTVPHVTIAPVSRGVGTKIRPGSRYFPYYTRPWISDHDFDPADDPSITSQQARAIDSAIDQYNDHITDRVRDARKKEKRDWWLLDVAGILDRLAARRYFDDPLARPGWWRPYPLPPALTALSPIPDSRFFSSDEGGRQAGGLFALDGVHPTTIAYGILAQEFCRIMERAGVVFYAQDGRTPRTGPISIDFGDLLANDTLISSPPTSFTSDLRLVAWFDQKLDLLRRLFHQGRAASQP
jgi:hypothetical protein